MNFLSTFGGIWTDTIESKDIANTLLEEKKINNSELEDLLFWINNGYLIKRNCIPSAFIDELQEEINDIVNKGLRKATYWENGEKLEENCNKNNILKEEAKVLDIHACSKKAQNTIFYKDIGRFLNILFEGPGSAFQSLYFETGSQQGLHQDTAFVYVNSPLEFVASWIALEDVDTNSGPLLFAPKSHRLPDNIGSSGTKMLSAGDEILIDYEGKLRNQCKENGYLVEEFLPKKGDVLFWAADLVHGGKKKINSSSTRKSLVTHYCPKKRMPLYQDPTKITLPDGNIVLSQT